VGKRGASGKGRRRPTRRQPVRGTAFCGMDRERVVSDSLPGVGGEVRAFVLFLLTYLIAVVFRPALLHWHVWSRPS